MKIELKIMRNENNSIQIYLTKKENGECFFMHMGGWFRPGMDLDFVPSQQTINGFEDVESFFVYDFFKVPEKIK